MAKKKGTGPRSATSANATWLRRPLILLAVTLLTGGSVGGWAVPELPIAGPLVQAVLALFGGSTDPTGQITEWLAPGPASSGLPGLDTGSPPARHGLVPRGPSGPPASATHLVSTSGRPADRVTIASYNIQVFGTDKLSRPEVVRTLATIVQHFDVVAIQEIRSKDDSVLPRFLAAVNAGGRYYDYVIGPRLGRTSSKEQYAFIFDTTRVEVNPASVTTIPDPDDYLHREPMMAQFRTRAYGPDRAFTFWLVNVHTDPDLVDREVNLLAKAFSWIEHAYPTEDDVIMLGDFNAAPSKMGDLAALPGIHCIVRGVTTNTRRTETYDNILFDARSTTEFTGRWGVVDVQQVFGLTGQQALDVSDHFPVWGEFYANEIVGAR